VLQKLLDHQGKDAPDPSAKNPRVPERLSQIVRKMMASDPRARYSTPDELILDLLPIAAGYGLRGTNPEGLVWTTTKPPQERFWERHVGWVVTAAMLLLIVFLINNFNQPGARPTPPASNAPPVASAGNPNRSPADPGKSQPAPAVAAKSGDTTPSALGDGANGDDPTEPPTLFENITSVVAPSGMTIHKIAQAASIRLATSDNSSSRRCVGRLSTAAEPPRRMWPQRRIKTTSVRAPSVSQAVPQISVLANLAIEDYPTLEAAAADVTARCRAANGWRGLSHCGSATS
jgi:hypothetical protein